MFRKNKQFFIYICDILLTWLVQICENKFIYDLLDFRYKVLQVSGIVIQCKVRISILNHVFNNYLKLGLNLVEQNKLNYLATVYTISLIEAHSEVLYVLTYKNSIAELEILFWWDCSLHLNMNSKNTNTFQIKIKFYLLIICEMSSYYLLFMNKKSGFFLDLVFDLTVYMLSLSYWRKYVGNTHNFIFVNRCFLWLLCLSDKISN